MSFTMRVERVPGLEYKIVETVNYSNSSRLVNDRHGPNFVFVQTVRSSPCMPALCAAAHLLRVIRRDKLAALTFKR